MDVRDVPRERRKAQVAYAGQLHTLFFETDFPSILSAYVQQDFEVGVFEVPNFGLGGPFFGSEVGGAAAYFVGDAVEEVVVLDCGIGMGLVR